MKKFFVFPAILMLILCSSVQVEAAKKVVAVMPLENVSGYREYKVAEIMTEYLMAAVQNSGIYTLAERTQAGAVLREQGFQNIASENPVEMGKMTGADYSLVGKVVQADIGIDGSGNFLKGFLNRVSGDNGLARNVGNSFVNGRRAKISLDYRMVDNKTGEIVLVGVVEGSKSGMNDQAALSLACKDASDNFLKELQKVNPFVARIAEIVGNEIYIDMGSDSGLRVGETLIIARESTPIMIHGRIVGMKNNVVGKAKVSEVNSDYAVCKIVSGGNMIKQGDVVKRG